MFEGTEMARDGGNPCALFSNPGSTLKSPGNAKGRMGIAQ